MRTIENASEFDGGLQAMHRLASFYRRDRLLCLALLICVTVYFFSAKGYLEVSDTLSSLQTAEAVLDRGRLDIPPYAQFPANVQLATLQGPDGRSYSKYGIGLPLYYVPFVAAARVLSAITKLPAPLIAGFLISFANLPFVALALVFFAKLLRLFGIGQTWTALLVLGLGLGTLTWRYAVYDFSEAMQLGLLMVAVYSVVRRTDRVIVAGGIAFAWLVLVKLIFVAFFPVFAIYLFTRPGTLRNRLRGLAFFALPFVVTCAFIGWLNAVRFGNALESGYGSDAEQFFPSQMSHTVPMLIGSLDKGLFVFCPILIVGLFGWQYFFQRHRPEAILCFVLIVLNLLWSASWHWWEGGWSWGPRLLVPTIPLWFLPAAFLLRQTRSRQRRGVVAVLILISIMSQIPGILIRDQEIHEIKEHMLTPIELAAAPSDYMVAYMLLRHKLVLHDERYRLSELRIPGTRQLDLTQYRTFRGLNTWTELSARQFNKPALRWFPILGLLILIYLTLQFGNAVKAIAVQDAIELAQVPGDLQPAS